MNASNYKFLFMFHDFWVSYTYLIVKYGTSSAANKVISLINQYIDVIKLEDHINYDSILPSP